MSAIVAGKCKKCNEDFWVTLGHPEWFDDVVKRRMPENDEFKEWKAWKLSGLCAECYGYSVK